MTRHDCPELAFITARLVARRSHVNPRCWGISSDALALYAVGAGPTPIGREYPSDPSDLAACYRTYDMAPAHLRKRMKPVLDRFHEHVARRYPAGAAEVRALVKSGRLWVPS